MHILTNNLVPEVELFLGVDFFKKSNLLCNPSSQMGLYMYTYKYFLDHTEKIYAMKKGAGRSEATEPLLYRVKTYLRLTFHWLIESSAPIKCYLSFVYGLLSCQPKI